MKVKLIKTVESTKTVTYEMELDINQVGEYLDNEEKFIDSLIFYPYLNLVKFHKGNVVSDPMCALLPFFS